MNVPFVPITPIIPQGGIAHLGETGTAHRPCEGVVCNPVCLGANLWSQKCVGGTCVPYKLLESNSTVCGGY